MAASRNGNLGAVGELLNAGAQPNLEDEVNIQAMSPDTYNNFLCIAVACSILFTYVP